MAEILVDSYSESNQNDEFSLYSAYPAHSQSFTAIAGNLSSCKFYLKKLGGPTGNIVAKLYAHSGVYGTSSVPTGAPLATSDNYDIATLTTSFQLIIFTFSGENQYTLVNGTKYVIVVEYSGGDGSNKGYFGFDSSGEHDGNFAYNDGTWHAQSSRDGCFYVYVDESPETVLIGSALYDSSGCDEAVVNKPLGTEDGDIMFALVHRATNVAASSVPSGWTSLGTYGIDPFLWATLYWKVADSEGASYTWGWAAPDLTRVTICAYRGGFDTADPIDVVSNTGYTTNSYIVRAASMAVSAAGSTLIFAGTMKTVSATTFTKPSEQDDDWVEDVDDGTSTSYFYHYFCHCNWSGSGASGVMDVIAITWGDTKHAFAVALNPEEEEPPVAVDTMMMQQVFG